MSLVIYLIDQLNCHVIGCKTRKKRVTESTGILLNESSTVLTTTND